MNTSKKAIRGEAPGKSYSLLKHIWCGGCTLRASVANDKILNFDLTPSLNINSQMTLRALTRNPSYQCSTYLPRAGPVV